MCSLRVMYAYSIGRASDINADSEIIRNLEIRRRP